MTLRQLEELTCKFFNITEKEHRSSIRKSSIIIVKHIFRATAMKLFKYSQSDVAKYLNINHASVYNSFKKIVVYDHFKDEFSEFVAYVGLNDIEEEEPSTDEVKEGNITRITQEAFDERFYHSPDKINPRTGNHYFPAYHFVTKMGAPADIGLEEWKLNKGNFVPVILEKTARLGSYVHDGAEQMVKEGIDISCEQIDQLFRNPKEAQKVKDCFLGFINFCNDYEPIILNSETMVIADDWGFTLDIRCKLNIDDYKAIRIVDLKTSKTAGKAHFIQVEAHRVVVKADKAHVLVLGNRTKKKYTLTESPIKKREYFQKLFASWKNTAYIEMLESGSIKPRENIFPSSFSLKKAPIKIQFEAL